MHTGVPPTTSRSGRSTSWHGNKFLNPVRDGAVLPILHLNNYKIADPTVLGRIPHAELYALLRGYGYEAHFVEGDEPKVMHLLMAGTLDTVLAYIKGLQDDARASGFKARPRWPMIVLRTPKGWTGPKVVDGQPVEGTFRSHQVPTGETAEHPEHVRFLRSG
jgi:xylulose-5-phosphate/fructose-6-phosphate phosphoketolase